MKRREVELSLTHPAADALAVYLSDTLGVGVSMDDPAALARLVQRGGWEAEDLIQAEDAGEEVRLRFYAAPEQNVDHIVQQIKLELDNLARAGVAVGSGDIRMREVDEEDWAHAWKAYYTPMAVGQRLWIQPVWDESETPTGRIRIWMDPGMAFGTGSHPTTRLCLEVLDRQVKGGETVLDIGTGSGILSVAAVLLGAEQALGVDIDSTAVTVAQKNSLLNGVESMTNFQVGVCEDARGPADIVVANIGANVIMDILSCVRERMKENGLFIASGIIRSRQEEVCSAFVQHGLQLENVLEDGDWVALTARRRDGS